MEFGRKAPEKEKLEIWKHPIKKMAFEKSKVYARLLKAFHMSRQKHLSSR